MFTVIGGMCYTVYLYHPFLKSFLKRALFKIEITSVYWVNSLLQIVLLSSAIIAVSAGFFLLFEKPFMHRDWPRKLAAWLRREKRAGQPVA